MQTVPVDDTPQARTLRAFTILHALRPNWGGQLILSIGLNPQGSALALASHIAGAVCLTLEPDPATAREALRSGSCDFVVNTLDEALRAMKNEVRKHHPLSVGLQGNPSEVFAELLDRGVAPQLITTLTAEPDHTPTLRAFQSHGAAILNFGNLPPIPDAIEATTLLATFLEERQWHAHDLAFEDLAALKHFDTRATDLLPDDDHLRRTWLHSASRIFPRERPPHRTLWLTSTERELLQQKCPTP
jgi:urocanate hydratase